MAGLFPYRPIDQSLTARLGEVGDITAPIAPLRLVQRKKVICHFRAAHSGKYNEKKLPANCSGKYNEKKLSATS
jgi:hypothetical protein